MGKAKIITYCHIKDRKIFLDGEMIYENQDGDLTGFLKSAFKHFKIKYPKFYKMDDISKLGFLTAEIMLSKISLPGFSDDMVGIVLSNAQSTLETDKAHQKTINDRENYFPSPAVFVYTLPNIMIGEISIRHKFNGENAFFIFDRFNADFIVDYTNLLFAEKKIDACLCGWVDLAENNCESFLYWAVADGIDEKNKSHNGKMVNKLYEKN